MINKCKCKASQLNAANQLVHNEHKIEKLAMGFKDAGSAAAFGFIDGFFGGMAEELVHMWHSKKCALKKDVGKMGSNVGKAATKNCINNGKTIKANS